MNKGKQKFNKVPEILKSRLTSRGMYYRIKIKEEGQDEEKEQWIHEFRLHSGEKQCANHRKIKKYWDKRFQLLEPPNLK